MSNLSNHNGNIIRKFCKEFYKGNQYIDLDVNGKIVEIPKTYYWEEREIYNHIAPIVEYVKGKFNGSIDRYLFCKYGLVYQLIPIQRAYNNLKNRKSGLVDRIVFQNPIIEDGSIDIDSLEEEGLAPGKILVYRSGSSMPNLHDYDYTYDLKALNVEEDKLLEEFDNIKLGFIQYLLNKGLVLKSGNN